MSTRLQLTTVDCDGCGLAVLECMGDGGWVQIPDKAWHLCPVCRSTVEYEVAGLREAVNEALLQSARTGESADQRAIERVRALAERAMSIVSRGCTCSGDDCSGKCRRGEPMGWDLDPAEVLRALEGDSDEPAGP